MKGYYFEGHVFKSITVQKEGICDAHCFSDDNCVSYNVLLSSGDGPIICELSNSDHQTHPEHLKRRFGSNYQATENACQKNPCPLHATCQNGFTDKGYRCIVHPHGPQVTVYSKVENTREGDNLTIRCVASGHPQPLVTWSKAEGDLPITRTIVRDAELLILNVTLHDSGLYVCSATNPVGSNSSTFALKVLPKQPIVGLQSTPRSENYQLQYSSYPTVSLHVLNTKQVTATAFQMETFKTAQTTQDYPRLPKQPIVGLQSTPRSENYQLQYSSYPTVSLHVLNTKQVTATAFQMETFKTAQTTQDYPRLPKQPIVGLQSTPRSENYQLQYSSYPTVSLHVLNTKQVTATAFQMETFKTAQTTQDYPRLPKQPIVGLQSTPRSENYQLQYSSYPTVSLHVLNTKQVTATAFQMETFKTAQTTQDYPRLPKQPIVGLQSTPRSENYQLQYSSYPTVSLHVLNTKQVTGTAFQMETFKTAQTTQETWITYETQRTEELPSSHWTLAIHSQETTLVMQSTQD
ncbi:uncharacterized protein LOC122960084 isoform X2 [Acropora millepora]|nr:uncharacterized protein LOC122960084 isoform X2 [Acropora millepora]XP_044177863.1 uncharacterized protein LOC122960084 isoform X2 [Acropora millepora]